MPEQKLPDNFMAEDARLLFLNFSGRETPNNREGDRNFCVVVPDDVAPQMIEDGWNIRVLQARDEGDTDTYYLPVTVGYKYKPAKITMIAGKRRTRLTEDLVEILDVVDMELVDLIVRPRFWERGTKSGIKAYLQTMYVTIIEDELERKYNSDAYSNDADDEDDELDSDD